MENTTARPALINHDSLQIMDGKVPSLAQKLSGPDDSDDALWRAAVQDGQTSVPDDQKLWNWGRPLVGSWVGLVPETGTGEVFTTGGTDSNVGSIQNWGNLYPQRVFSGA